MNIKLLRLSGFAVLLLITGSRANAVTKTAQEVFGRWIEIQQIVPELKFSPLAEQLTSEKFIQDFKKSYEQALKSISPQVPFLSRMTGNAINTRGYRLSATPNELFVSNMTRLYHLADASPAAFLSFLGLQGLIDEQCQYRNSSDLIEQYNSLTKLFFAGQPEAKKTEYLFNLANKYFDFCFAPGQFSRFQDMTFDQDSHPQLKYVLSVMWLQLAGQGWKVWHENTLKNLSSEAKAGKTVKYIAGGSDIYQLLRSGVYNIINIDPQLPSQPKYYTNDWEFILQGNTDDRIVFNQPEAQITMLRRPMKKNGKVFQARIATGQTINLEESETVWDIYNNTSQQKIGSYTLKRRFVNQDDFKLAPHETLLMSFNELYFVCLPDFLQGWHINPTEFSRDITMHVKQLAHPLGKEEICNMHVASMINSTDLGYIALGTCIN